MNDNMAKLRKGKNPVWNPNFAMVPETFFESMRFRGSEKKSSLPNSKHGWSEKNHAFHHKILNFGRTSLRPPFRLSAIPRTQKFVETTCSEPIKLC